MAVVYASLTAASFTLGFRPCCVCSSTHRSGVLAMAASATPLFSFEGEQATEALSAFERIDDVIMGGISSSRLVLATDDRGGAIFEGRLREEGGGFCGQRMRLLAEPVDLSSACGIYIECDGSETDCASRVWKVAVRTKQDRGEVVYQAAFEPPNGRQVVRIPFNSFRLVRGPRLVPGALPLTAAQTNETYQISLVVSKFQVSETGEALPGFKDGPFALRLYGLGTYAAESASLVKEPPVAIPRAMSSEEQAAASPPVLRLLRPLLGFLFGESARRRRAATLVLKSRGTNALGRARLGWAWRAGTSRGVLATAGATGAILARDAAALLLSLPVRLLFRLVFLTARMVKRVKEALGGGAPVADAVRS